MPSFLTFQLYGPLASWGEVAVGEERDSDSIPTRTAVLGMCAAALGIPRGQNDEISSLNAGLGFAVAVLSEGSLLRDYHTIESPSGKRARDLGSRRKELEYDNTGTTLSKRHYRSDALYLVSLWERPGAAGLLEQLDEALKKPGFPLFLGRKSCPLALPLAPRLSDSHSLVEALRTYPVSSLVDSLMPKKEKEKKKARLAWDNDASVAIGLDAQQVSARWDRLISRERWQFGRRDQALAVIDLTEVSP